jgi:glucose/arabinose dehydrogenase
MRVISLGAVSALALAFASPGLAQAPSAGNLEKLGNFQQTGTPEMAHIPQTGPKADAIRKTLATKIKLPKGFHISLYALVPDARHIAVGPQGIVTFVGTRKSKVWSVTDRAKMRVADEVKEFAPSIGGIVRMSREGKDREVFAWGVRNSVGMDFNPKDKTLWFTDNQVDGMGDDQPPGELNRADKPGMNFGFPYYGGGKTRTTEYKDQQVPAGVTFPQVEMAAHAADLGMTFYSGRQFPQKYRGGIFSAQHGSWNRTVPIGARVMFTSLKEDGTADKTEPFAEGWNDNGEYLGRPVDVARLPDGSILA